MKSLPTASQITHSAHDSGRRRWLRAALSTAGVATLVASAREASGAPRANAPRLSAEDRFGIEDLFARYAWSYDCSDEEEYLANFTTDAIIVGASPGQLYQGTEAIRGWFRYLIDLRGREGDDWLHDAYHHQVFGDRRSCLVYSFATHFNVNMAANRSGVRSGGYFASECVAQRGQWLFRRHSVNRWDRTRLPWKKPLPWEQAVAAAGR